ncbi:MAG: LysM peptidoglycan-binding domain-containing protein [Clostridia bacterium]|nr:LysM peptidoglycan-binding domain-containing protein [Clostridia bacterium]
MKLKIVNKTKFFRSFILFTVALSFILLNIGNKSASEEIQNYKTITVNSGDTLWSIAQYEKNENNYYKDTDIREIVHDIKEINNLKSSNLNVNQSLKIPTNTIVQ